MYPVGPLLWVLAMGNMISHCSLVCTWIFATGRAELLQAHHVCITHASPEWFVLVRWCVMHLLGVCRSTVDRTLKKMETPTYLFCFAFTFPPPLHLFSNWTMGEGAVVVTSSLPCLQLFLIIHISKFFPWQCWHKVGWLFCATFIRMTFCSLGLSASPSAVWLWAIRHWPLVAG